MKKTSQPPRGPQGRDRGQGTAPPRGGARSGPQRAQPLDRNSDSRGDARGPARGPAKGPSERPARGQPAAAPSTQVRPARAPSAPPPPPGRPALQASTAKGNLLYGLHPVAAAWVNPDRKVRSLFVTDGALASLAPALSRAAELGIERPDPVIADREQLDRLLPNGAVHQGAALDCSALPDLDIEDVIAKAEAAESALIVILDQVTDPHNVGAILRSAAAFGAMAVVVQDRHAPPVTGVLAKTASGAVEAVPLVRVTNLSRAITDLQQAGFWCVGLAESGARALHELDMTNRIALVMGSEGEGIRRLTAERCDEIAHLPTGGPVGSLNVSNAAAVALYEVARRR